MNSWQPIETYPIPNESFDYKIPEILVYSPTLGVKMAQCVRFSEPWEEDEGEPVEIQFIYYDGQHITDATHWMPLPKAPTAFGEIMKKVQNNLSKLSDEELENRMNNALNSEFYHLMLNATLYASEICTKSNDKNQPN